MTNPNDTFFNNQVWVSESNILHSNSYITSNMGKMSSLNNEYHLLVQSDGNLVLKKSNTDIWRSGSSAEIGKYYLTLLNDGTLLVNKGTDINNTEKNIWKRRMSANMIIEKYFLILENNGHMSIYRGDSLSNNKGLVGYIRY
jgi:hypothetical protein